VRGTPDLDALPQPLTEVTSISEFKGGEAESFADITSGGTEGAWPCGSVLGRTLRVILELRSKERIERNCGGTE